MSKVFLALLFSRYIAIASLAAAVPSSLAADFDFPHRDRDAGAEITARIKEQMPPKATAAKAGKSARMDKIDRSLRSLMESADRKGDETAPGKFQVNPYPLPRLQSDGNVQVYVKVSTTSQQFVDALASIGLDIEIVDKSLNMLQGWIALERLPLIADFDEVVKVSTPEYGRTRIGSVTTQGDVILKANQLRSMGLRGKGVRVGILSDGANDWMSAQASGNLPSRGITRFGSCTKQAANPSTCQSAATCNEGTAMAEIIHDIAPDADIAVGAVATTLDFIQRANQLANNFKADIIVDDIGFFAEGYFEDTDLAEAVATVASKVLFVSAAGNSARNHYERQYLKENSTSFHDFGKGEGGPSDIFNGVFIPAKTSVLAILQWNDRFGKSGNDYDLAMFDSDNNLIILGNDIQDGDDDPIEGFSICNTGSSDEVGWLVIDKHSGNARRLELFALAQGPLQYNHPGGSVFGHPALPDVVAVGSINADDPGHNTIAPYSSRGPSRIDFPSLQNRKKPDVTAIDGVKVSGVGGFPSVFFGTSAAAPHVAGIAALLMSDSPLANRTAVSKALMDGTVDLGAKGFDSTFGYGRLDAVRAKALLRLIFDPSPTNLLLFDEES